MKNSIGLIIQKYKIVVISAIIVIVLGLCCLSFTKSFGKMIFIKSIDNDYYALSYDNTWGLKEKNNDNIVLKHHSGSSIVIQISELTDEYRYAEIEELIDEIIYDIQKQNVDYKLVSQKDSIITKYNFHGYKLLYENDDRQVMVSIFKQSDKLIIIRYEATDDYFDILLDSVNTIINSLEVKNQTFALKNNIELDTSNGSFEENSDLDNLLGEEENYFIAKNNYIVEYSLPSVFQRSTLDSTLGQFSLKVGTAGKINLVIDVYNRNIYEYLSKNEKSNVYSSYEWYHKGDYENFQESLTELTNTSYLYKNSYNSEKKQYENGELVYALDNNHIFIVKIQAVDTPITKELVNKIKLDTISNYANYIKIEKDDNLLLGTLQRFSTDNKDLIEKVTLRIPDKYVEVDKKENVYLKRNYYLGYNEQLDLYDYEIHYELTTLSDESIINSINSIYVTDRYGEAQKLHFSGEVTINSKVFKIYDGGYTGISGIMFTNINRNRYYIYKKLLFYKMPTSGYLYIEINGNDKEITNEMINELVSFNVKEEKEVEK